MDERMRSTAAAARVLTSIYLSYYILLCPPVCVTTCDRETAPQSSSKTQKSISVCVFSHLTREYFSSKRLSRP